MAKIVFAMQAGQYIGSEGWYDTVNKMKSKKASVSGGKSCKCNVSLEHDHG
jgi:hypothetical protein